MSVLRVFLTADSEFAIENLPKPKGNPEINAREKSTLFSQFSLPLPVGCSARADSLYLTRHPRRAHHKLALLSEFHRGIRVW